MSDALNALIVEDSENDTLLLIHELVKSGFKVVSQRVDTAEEMKAKLDEKKWDVIFCDYGMPHFNSFEALTLVRGTGLDTPFIIVSGTIGEERAVEAMRAGANDYVLKGNLKRLLPAVKRELKEAKMRAERKELEERLRQAQKMEAVGHLAGGIAHDFNNILAVIIMYCEMILDRIAPTEALFEEVEEIKKAGERAAGLTRQLLAFSRKQILEPKILDLNEIVSGIKNMTQRITGEDIQHELVLASDLWQVRADPGQIEQIIMNLVVNARDAMPQGGKITLSTSNIEITEMSDRSDKIPPGKYTILSVADTGTGMDQATMQKIFEPFFTTKGVGKGTGLGLSTVHGIVHQSGGQIIVSSELKKGTTFDIYFPAIQVVAETIISTISKKIPEVVKPGIFTILLIEDDKALRGVVQRLLEKAGYIVLPDRSNEEILKDVEQKKISFDLLVTDVIMPEISGPEMAEKLVSILPGLKILFVSGYLDDRVDNYVKIKDRANFLQKPFTANQLVSKVEKILSVPKELDSAVSSSSS